jgi:hypothetical protein
VVRSGYFLPGPYDEIREACRPLSLYEDVLKVQYLVSCVGPIYLAPAGSTRRSSRMDRNAWIRRASA